MRSRHSRIAVGVTLTAMVALGVVATVAQETSLNKPLTQFTIGDLFPKMVDDEFRQTGKVWQQEGENLVQVAQKRSASVDAAVSAKKSELDSLKTQLKAAKKDKNFEEAGALEGKIKTEEIVVNVLERIQALSKTQVKFAEAGRDLGIAMQAFVDADDAFDRYRATPIARPEAGAADTRLSGAGFQAFVDHANSADGLGKAYGTFGSTVSAMASGRLKLLKDLEKGGHVVPSK